MHGETLKVHIYYGRWRTGRKKWKTFHYILFIYLKHMQVLLKKVGKHYDKSIYKTVLTDFSIITKNFIK